MSEPKYRIIETEDGRFFPQVFAPSYLDYGEKMWLFINEFSRASVPWYTTYKYEAKPKELEEWCFDKSECERILKAAREYFERLGTNMGEHKTATNSAIKNVFPL